MRHLFAILSLCLLSLCGYAQGFNEDSLYMAIQKMPDDTAKLAAIHDYIFASNDLERVYRMSKYSLDLSDKLHDLRHKCHSLSIMGRTVALRDGDMTTALKYLFESLQLSDSIGDYNRRSINLQMISSAFFNKNEISAGIEYLQMSLDETLAAGDTSLICKAYNLQGWAYMKLQLCNFALGSFQTMHQMAQASNNERQQYVALYGICNTYLTKYSLDSLDTDLDSAMYFMDKVLPYFDSRTNPYLPIYQTFPTICIDKARRAASKSERRRFLSRADSLVAIGDSLMDERHEYVYRDNINLAKAMLMMEKGLINDALVLLKSIDIHLAYDAWIRYYTIQGDYRNKLRMMEQLQLYDRLQAGIQTLISKDPDSPELQYKKHVQEIERIKHERELSFQLQRQRAQQINKVFVYIVALALAVVFVFALSYISTHHINSQLSYQTNLIGLKNSELEKLQDRVKSQTEELLAQSKELAVQTRLNESTNKKLMTGIFYAQNIQRAVVPSQEMMNELFGDCLIYWRPLMVVSGDFYWATRIRNYKILAVCDCTGHGVPGALLSILGVSFLNDIISFNNGKEPNAAEMLSTLRTMILREIGEECDDGMDMGLLVIDTQSHQMQYAGAMRPMYLLRDGDFQIYKPNRMPIGRYVIKDKPFTNNDIQYQEGDRVYMFSDGLTDVFTPDRSRKLSDRGFRDFLHEHCNKPFAEQKQVLTDYYNDWGQDAIIDDQLLVAIQL